MKAIWIPFIAFAMLPKFFGTATAFDGRSRPSSCRARDESTNDQGCSSSNIAVRREWDCHTDAEKLDFINSVKCLMERPNRTPSSAAPGARSRYDDFVLNHINSTFNIHGNGVFLPWHRHYLFLFETAMRDECGYAGYLPFMYWPEYAADLAHSSIFDGSSTSLGSDGDYNASNPSPPNGNYTPPAGAGGGCIVSGPFANLTGNFRNFPLPGNIFSLPADALDYNPHCVRRNLNSAILSNSNNESAIERLLGENDIIAFQRRMDSNFYPGGMNIPDYGIHAGGHGGVGGDMSDFFASPSDPVFWLHHAMVDLLWTTWQARDPPHRQYALNGTDILLNDPSGTTVSVDYVQSFAYLDHPRSLGSLMDTQKGPYRYRYEY